MSQNGTTTFKKGKKAAAATATKPKKVKATEFGEPRRNLSAYNLYQAKHRAAIKLANPEASFGQLSAILGAQWKKDNEGEKTAEVRKLEEQAAADKAAYEEKMAEWKKANPEDARKLEQSRKRKRSKSGKGKKGKKGKKEVSSDASDDDESEKEEEEKPRKKKAKVSKKKASPKKKKASQDDDENGGNSDEDTEPMSD